MSNLRVSIITINNFKSLTEDINYYNKTDYYNKINLAIADKQRTSASVIAEQDQRAVRDQFKEVIKDMPNVDSGLGSSTAEGQGIVFLPDNPVKLFYQLTKLLAATKAGHTNTYNQVNAICKRLLELKLLTTDKYKKVLSKYFPTKRLS